jgi:effector-binding domain-containing protein
MKQVCACVLLVISMMLVAGDAEKAQEIKVIEVEAFDYAAIDVTGSYDQHAVVFGQLYQAAGEQQLSMDKPPFGIYLNSPMDTPEDSLKWEVGLVVSADTDVKSPLIKKLWSLTPVATLHYEGVFSEESMGAAYGQLYGWVAQNGYTVTGPMLEKYLGPPTTNEDGEMSGKVDIWVPVKKSE